MKRGRPNFGGDPGTYARERRSVRELVGRFVPLLFARESAAHHVEDLLEARVLLLRLEHGQHLRQRLHLERRHGRRRGAVCLGRRRHLRLRFAFDHGLRQGETRLLQVRPELAILRLM